MKKKEVKKTKKDFIKWIIITILIIGTLTSCIVIYLNTYYHADNEVKKYLKNSDQVKVVQMENSYLFDGPSEKRAIIFYPGAKVDYTAYAPLMNKIASTGADCFLLKMPHNLAILNKNAAEEIINKYEYEEWYLAGHSLGGAVAALYLDENPEKVKGIILLASYSTKKIKNDILTISIYGENDGILNLKNYEKYKKNWSKNAYELIIDGGNHADFGNYGNQKDDKPSTITKEIQQSKTVNFIIDSLNQSN